MENQNNSFGILTKTQNKKIAVVLFNLGGPSSLDSVPKFLFNLFNDKAIIPLIQPFRFLVACLITTLRSKKSQNIYSQINNKSPLLEITNQQSQLLEQILNKNSNQQGFEYKNFVIMRYWHPRAKNVVKEIANYQPEEIILLPLYPQFSTTTNQSSIDEFLLHWQKLNQINSTLSKIAIKTICCHPEEDGFIESHCNLIINSLQKSPNFSTEKIENYRLLFSAHGLPQKVIDDGDPYCFQVGLSVEKIIEKLSSKLQIDRQKIDYKICFQSKVGPAKWTEPTLDSQIDLAAKNEKSVVVIPIAFVSDHSETLVELDIDYANKAKELKIAEYIRVESLNFEQNFLSCLANLCFLASKNQSIQPKNCTAETKLNCVNKRICPHEHKKCPNNF